MSDHMISTQLLSRDLGFEHPERAVQLNMIDRINDELAAQEGRWEHADLELQQLAEGGPGQVELERFEAINIKAGPHRTIIDAPPDGFPAMSIQSGIALPRATQFDQFDNVELTLFVEVFVKTGPVHESFRAQSDHEVILNRRIERTTEAAHAVVLSDRALYGAAEVQTPPRGRLYPQAWVKEELQGRGQRYMWQGARLEYTLNRQASFQ